MQRRQFAFALCLLPSAALAQSKGEAWPARSVRIVCPFAPGGSQDALARRIATKLGEYLGQQFIVDNRGGAGGTIAYDNVAKSPPDGYSLLLGGLSSHALVEHLYSNLTFNPATDLEVAAWIGTQPALLCCHPNYAHATISGLAAAATATPGKIAYGAAGTGTSPTLAMEVFKQKARINLTLISYRGSAAAAADVVAGHVPLVVATINSLMGLVKSGKLKPVATTGHARSPAIPDTPTFSESGFPDVVVTSWSLLAVPKGTPAGIKQAILAATERAVQSTDVIANMTAGGFEPETKPVAEVEAFIRAERVRWGEVIRAAGIKPE